MKEILKMWCQSYILMNKVIILKKIQVTMKTFAPPFINHFSFRLNRKKTCGNESHEKKTEHLDASAVNLLHIRIGNLDWCKCWNCKIDARIDCLCCREGNTMLSESAKVSECEGKSCHPVFLGNCLTISHTC